MTVRHIVCWKLVTADPSERAAQALGIKDALEGLRGRLPGLLDIEVGVDLDNDEGNYDVVLTSLFTDAQALAHHQAARSVAGRIAGPVAVDYHLAVGRPVALAGMTAGEVEVAAALPRANRGRGVSRMHCC